MHEYAYGYMHGGVGVNFFSMIVVVVVVVVVVELCVLVEVFLINECLIVFGVATWKGGLIYVSCVCE